MRLVVGIIGGAFVAVIVFMLAAFFLGRMFEGTPPLDTIVGFIVPILLGLLAGASSFRASVKRGVNSRRREQSVNKREDHPA